jgi:hypothetical protein
MKHWVKQNRRNFEDVVALYTNILTLEGIYETKCGQTFSKNTHKPCDKPTDFFLAQEIDNWEFVSGGNIYNEDATEDEEPIYHYGSYCCDGDGIVSVELLVDGKIRLLDQGEYMLDLSSNLDEAIQQAAEYLKEQYPEIYEIRLALVKS